MKKPTTLISVVSILIIILFSCEKDKAPKPPNHSNKIEFENSAIDSVGYTTVKISTSLTSTGGNDITQHGHCWSIETEPTIENDKTSLGKLQGPKSFTSELLALTDNTKYYIRAYFTFSNGTIYNSEITSTTLKTGKPVIITSEVTDITLISAVCGGTVMSDSGLLVTARGVCWSTTINPSLQNCLGYTTDGSGSGNFSSYLTDLEENIAYYVAAYATNEKGTCYGLVKFFTTLDLTIPELTTDNVTNITTNSAQSGGNVTNDGNGTVCARGVCWNTSGNPTLQNCLDHTTDGSGLGIYTSIITGLEEETTYYVAAYATNEEGTGYGNVKSFTTEIFLCGETVLYGGQTYNTVLIGDQCWMKENLNIGTRINGVDEQTNNGTIEKYCYDDDELNCDEYGGLYQWNEMMQYNTQQRTQGICPSYWHIPNDDEWDELVDYLGGYDVAGGKMKEAGTVHWSHPNSGATNSSGFTGLPGGWRDYNNGSFVGLGVYGHFWSSTSFGSSFSNYKGLYYQEYGIYPSTTNIAKGISVRCLKN